jgi:hypothetical protein
VAWAAAPNFIWDATGWDGILIQALYPPSGLPVWSRAAEETRFVIQDYSNRLGRYPYPTAINVHGPVHGMEYPMVVFCSGQESDRHLFVCACHELGHQWFPMTVGSNERLFGWQDEGLVNFIGISVFHDRLPDDDGMEAGFAPDGMVEWLPPLVNPEHTIMMPIDWGPNSIYFLHTVKSAVALNLLRREIVDSVALDAAFREYATRWAFKHPTPADFFRTIDDALGKDLSWFWGSWFFRTDQLDFAIDSVTQSESEGTVTSEIHFSRKARMVAPVDFFIQGADGTEQHVRIPVEVWQRGPAHTYPLITPTAAQPVRIEIDHKRAFPDIDRENNTWLRRR